MKKVAILQSNYIPWKGYFDIINMVDEFIIYDTVQFTKNDWRNRNLIKTATGKQWLTIPVKHSISQNINEIEVLNSSWTVKHWKTLLNNYSKAPYFERYKQDFEHVYAICAGSEKLSWINFYFISLINRILGIKTKITWSSDYKIAGERSERLLYLCEQAGATEYLSGPAAKDYLDTDLFEMNNIKVSWMNYAGYPEYEQLYPPFDHGVSIIDLIFNTGPEAKKYMLSFKNE